MDPKSKTKPGLARSLLQRVSSRTDVDQDVSSTAAMSETSSPQSPIPRSALSTDVPIRGATSPTQAPAAPSIEQSVRMFRLYDALRSGDTAAISKVIGESSGSRPDGEPRASTSSSFNAATSTSGPGLEGTSVLHLAVQCADVPVIEYLLSNEPAALDVNSRDKDGNTPLHIASLLSRTPVVQLLLQQKDINDSLVNYQGRTALDLAKSPEVFQQLQLSRSIYVEAKTKDIQKFVKAGDYESLERLLADPHFQSVVDVNGGELASDPATTASSGTLLHEAARKSDTKLIQILLLNGADPFQRDRKGRLPQDVTKDDKTRAIIKKSPAAVAAQRGIQEKTILGSGNPQILTGTATGENALGGKEGREMKGYLKKWVNFTTGYKLRWFILEDGILSYYKNQDDHGSACRGAINMRIAKLHMDPKDKLRFEIIGKSSVKYHLKANHEVEAKRWFWALNNAVQFSKDEAKEAEKAQSRNEEILRQAKIAQSDRLQPKQSDPSSIIPGRSSTHLTPTSTSGVTRTSTRTGSGSDYPDEGEGGGSLYEASTVADEAEAMVHSHGATAIEGEPEDEDFGDDASEVEVHPVKKDAFFIAANSARLQLEMLSQISAALQEERMHRPNTTISESHIGKALSSYEAAVANLNGLVGDLGRISRDREAYWHYRLEQETNIRRIWEDNMTQVAREQEELETKIGESEEKRKQVKRALRDVLEGQVATAQVETFDDAPLEQTTSPASVQSAKAADKPTSPPLSWNKTASGGRRKSTMADITNIAASEDEDVDDEFFDAIDAGEVEVVEELPPTIASPPREPTKTLATVPSHDSKLQDIQKSYAGYEDPVRKRLKMDSDNRPKISLWGILKSMIGKDMTKMTLPVSFNEPTSLLQRVAEDMEYTDLLDMAADRADPLERMVYVAAFAASEYASTIGRVAKPFNPLLGETYEYVRPDKGYRFFVEQVSHHPPIGAAWAESAKWEYYGESAVKSKFYGKSFDINPLGTWFLKLRPTSDNLEANGATNGSSAAKTELYTWKKVTSSVVGIITGNPTVDNYGSMEIRNHNSGEVCILEFKQRGWKASSAYQVTGRVMDKGGNTCWSIGGYWNEKIYARATPGFEDSYISSTAAKNQAVIVWEANPRPNNIPFNLTPFVVTLNALPGNLRQHLPPTDTRLRPDQRAMEDGEYDFAATEKNRVEEKQRAKRREREINGEEFEPKWFHKDRCPTTGEEYWVAKGSQDDGGSSGGAGIHYWIAREKRDWSICDDIF